ncbi:hypothetical protein Cni_G13615 [Canna indica]|uniref:Uncharacterized protein n=1 Tax=Canna indica TaxID=4628 RepID=A0AAQ3K9V2_9LILI|nr:hypothetical protein Cni_G13615 [Canna indica]
MTSHCGVVIPPWCVGGARTVARCAKAPTVVSLHQPPHNLVGSDQMRIQLDQLRAESEIARSKANSARLRLMRLTEVVENHQRRAARDIQVGKETEARELLIQKRKLMQALEKSKNRIEETQLIGQVAIQPEDRADSCQQIHFLSPKEDTVEVSNSDSSQAYVELILEHIDMKLRLVEADIENFLRFQVNESKEDQVNEKLQNMLEILKDVLSIRERAVLKQFGGGYGSFKN